MMMLQLTPSSSSSSGGSRTAGAAQRGKQQTWGRGHSSVGGPEPGLAVQSSHSAARPAVQSTGVRTSFIDDDDDDDTE